MTNQYEEEVYKFFTQPQNFETMVKVLEHSEMILKEVPRRFWYKLKDELNDEFKGTAWVADFSDSNSNPDSWGHGVNKLMVYKPEWRNGNHHALVAIAFENLNYGQKPFCGIFIDRENHRKDSGNLRDAVKEMELLKNKNDTKNEWWVSLKDSLVSTCTMNDLKDLIGEACKTSIENAKRELLTLKELIEPEIDTLIKPYLK